MPAPYRRSVWWDVAAVVFVVALLLAPAGFLATELIGGGGLGSGRTRVAASNRGPAVTPPRSGVSARRARRSARPPALQPVGPSPVRAAETNSPQTSVPFSSTWRERATPSLSGGAKVPSANRSVSGSAGTASGGAESFGSSSDAPGRRTRKEGATRWSLEPESPAEWTADARRLAGRARALSNQLGQMGQESGRASSEARQSEERRAASSGAGTTSQADNPPLPGEDPTVPIDDHLHWLLVAGVLWGVWRLWRGG